MIPVDIDLDGDVDLITSYSLTDEVILGINNGNDNWQMVQVGNNIVAMFAMTSDFDGDNDLDVVTVFDLPGVIAWFEHPANLANTWTQNIINNSVTEVVEFTRGDFNNDGHRVDWWKNNHPFSEVIFQNGFE